MKKVLIIILTFISSAGFAQNIDFQLISFNGLKFYSPKSEIVEKLGQPEKIFEPKYECGFLSAESQSTKYFTLDFKNIKFTGNHGESYLIEFIDFNNDNSIILKYGKFSLNSETRLSELIEIFGKEFKESFKNNNSGKILLLHNDRDDGVIIKLKKGKLARLEYWSPC